jgi:hypothetical protein
MSAVSMNVHDAVTLVVQRIEYANFHEYQIVAINSSGEHTAEISFLCDTPPKLDDCGSRKAAQSSAPTTPNQE